MNLVWVNLNQWTVVDWSEEEWPKETPAVGLTKMPIQKNPEKLTNIKMNVSIIEDWCKVSDSVSAKWS